MINAITLLKMHAEDLRRMTTSNANTISEWTAKENAKLADEYEFAAEALRTLHRGGLADLKAIAESAARKRSSEND